MKAFLICPVRGKNPRTYKDIVDLLEIRGYAVYFPPYDTDQDDPTGYRICQDNLKAIQEAEHVFIVWDGESQGCLFDAGMAFALNKPITVIESPRLIHSKSFQDMFHEWQERSET